MNESKPVRYVKVITDTTSTPCNATSTLITTTNTSYGTNSRSGVTNYGHHEQERLGVTATTPFVGEFSNIYVQPGEVYRRAVGIACPKATKPIVESRRTGAIFTASARAKPTTSLDQDADNQAIAVFLGNANNAMTSLAGMNVLGELKETIEGIRHPLKSYRKLVDRHFQDLRRRSWRRQSNKQKVQVLTDTYLEAVFGWSPLVGDIQDALNAYERYLNDTRNIIYVEGGGRAESVDSPISSTSSLMNNVTVLTNVFDKSKTSIRYVGGVKAQLYGQNVAHARDLCGFRLDQFVPTLWELVPYSFLVDYFTNVGDIVGAACFSASNLSWRCKTVKRTARREVAGRVDSASMAKALGVNYRGSGGNPGSSTHEWKQIVRSADGPGVPSISFMLPGQSIKWLNMAALATNYGLARVSVNGR